MAELPSKQFRKIYPALTEVTQVTSYGRLLGTWTPADVVAAKGPRIITLPADTTRTQVAAIQAQNSSVPPYDWSDYSLNASSMAPGDDPDRAITLASPKPRPISVQKVPDTSFGHSRPAPKPGKKR